MTSREFFGELQGQEFRSFQELQQTILRAFNERLEQFPPQYSYLQLIDWGKRNQWIVSVDGKGFRIQVSEDANRETYSRQPISAME
jgi:hypothetical protein